MLARARIDESRRPNTALDGLGLVLVTGVMGRMVAPLVIAAAVFAGTGGYGSAQAFNDGFVAAISACAGLSLLGALAGLALPPARVGSRALHRTATGVAPAEG